MLTSPKRSVSDQPEPVVAPAGHKRGRTRHVRAITLLLTLAISLPLAAAADENDAIVSLIERNVAAFRDFDAEGASSTYAAVADWINAFGVRQHVRLNIRTCLSNSFAGAQFRSLS